MERESLPAPRRELAQRLERVDVVRPIHAGQVLVNPGVERLRPVHLLVRRRQDRRGPGVLRIAIEAAAKEDHHVDVQTHGPALREAVRLGPDHAPQEGRVQLLVAQGLAQVR